MKRCIKLVISFSFVLLFLVTSALGADDNRYHFEDTSGEAHSEVTVIIPEEFTVFTRDTGPNDIGAEKLGVDVQAIVDYFKSNDIYLDAYAPDLESEIFIRMNTTKDSIAVNNMNLISDKELENYRVGIVQNLKDNGFTLLSYQSYKSNKQKFIYMHLSYTKDDGSTLYAEAYSTVINKYQVSFYLDNYTQDLTDSQKEILKQIVDTAYFYPEPVSAVVATAGKLGSSFLSGFIKYAIIGIVLAGVSSIVAAVKKKKQTSKVSAKGASPDSETAAQPQVHFSNTTQNPVSIITCPTCGLTNPKDRLLCYRCGNPLDSNLKIETAAIDESETM